jgi:hypothetical protein
MMSSSENTPSSPTREGADKARGRLVAGCILLTIAVLALAAPHVRWAWQGGGFLLLLGVAFVVWAALGRVAGLLVPGGILIGIGVGTALRPEYGNTGFLFSLAAGFLLISVLQLALFGRKAGKGWWTVWPAGGIALSAIVSSGGPELREFFRALRDYWPYALIVVALALIFSGLRKKS